MKNSPRKSQHRDSDKIFENDADESVSEEGSAPVSKVLETCSITDEDLVEVSVGRTQSNAYSARKLFEYEAPRIAKDNVSEKNRSGPNPSPASSISKAHNDL